MHRWALGLVAVLGVAGCAGTQHRGGATGDEARPIDGDRMACAVAVSPGSRGGRIEVRASCGLPLMQADSGEISLSYVARSGPPPDEVPDSELRATAEYRSLTDSRNVWQWGDRVTDAEALATCRLMQQSQIPIT